MELQLTDVTMLFLQLGYLMKVIQLLITDYFLQSNLVLKDNIELLKLTLSKIQTYVLHPEAASEVQRGEADLVEQQRLHQDVLK